MHYIHSAAGDALALDDDDDDNHNTNDDDYYHYPLAVPARG
jgi:hypothetical protein